LTQKLIFAVENIRPSEREIDNSQFALLKVDAFATGKSAHGTFVTEETLRRTAKTIILKPFVFAIDKNLQDLSTHLPTEIPGGFVPHDSPIEFRELADSRIMMTVDVLVWRRYSGKLLEYFERDGNRKGVSVEIEVFESREDKISGLLEIVDFCYNAITGLGDFIRSAIPNAQAVLQFSQEYKDAYIKEFSDKYSDIDFTIPQIIKDNAKKSLDTYKESGSKATSVSLAMARFLVKSNKITPEKIRQMAKFFERKVEYDDLTMGFFGGKDGGKWSKSLFDSIDEIDSKRVSYFDVGGENMPYKKVEDMNPALKGIDPPISLAQGNAIAKQADAIGADKEKNGWAIAIASFKKSHEVEDGKWVKKEKMADETSVAFEKNGNDKLGDNPEKNKEEKEISMADEKKVEEEVKETPAEEKVESPEEEKKEKEEGVEMATVSETPEEEKKEGGEEQKFSLNAYVDVAATLAYLQAETEDNEEMAGKLKMAVEEIEKGEFASPPVVMSGMFASMCRMSAKMCKMAEKMVELEKFKSDVEGQQKMAEVEKTLGEMAEKVVIPEEAMSEMRASADKFSFEQLDAWKNECKAKSFDFAVKDKKGETHLRIGLPIINKIPRPQNDVWAGTK
jgi:hypothetical protein